MDANIVNALRKGTEVVLKKFGTEIVLTPHNRVKAAGGKVDWVPQTPRDPQVFVIEPVAATLAGITGAAGGLITTQGAKTHNWSYVLTGRYNCQIAIGDTWENGETSYRIEALNPYNAYERTAAVAAIGKDPAYGS